MKKQTRNFSQDFEVVGRVLETFVVLNIIYTWYPSEPQTADCPGDNAHIEIESIMSHGQEVTDFIIANHPELETPIEIACWEHIEPFLKEEL